MSTATLDRVLTAAAARKAARDFRAGRLKSAPAEDVIAGLRAAL